MRTRVEDQLRAGVEEVTDSCLNPLERLVGTRRSLESSLAIDQKNRRVTRDVAIEVGNLPTEGEQRVAHRHLFHIFPLQIGVLIRQPEHNERLILPLSVCPVDLRHLLPAGPAPGCPNIDELDLALLISQALGSSPKSPG